MGHILWIKFYLLDNPDLSTYNLQNLKKGFIAGSYCHPTLIEKIIDKLSMEDISIVYGQTEGIAITQTLPQDSLFNRLNTIGRALKGVNAKIIDIQSKEEVKNGCGGELCVKTEYLMKGYYKNKAETERTVDQDGWLHTGDLAAMDDEGYIKIKGRIKDIIIRGGENISPAEIENVIKEFPGVQDAAVVSVPDPILGEDICLFIIPSDSETVTTSALLEYAKKKLAKYKIPKYINFVSEFPLNSSGKINKFILRERIIQKNNLINIVIYKLKFCTKKTRLSVFNAFSGLFLGCLRDYLCKLLLQFYFATAPFIKKLL